MYFYIKRKEPFSFIKGSHVSYFADSKENQVRSAKKSSTEQFPPKMGQNSFSTNS